MDDGKQDHEPPPPAYPGDPSGSFLPPLYDPKQAYPPPQQPGYPAGQQPYPVGGQQPYPVGGQQPYMVGGQQQFSPGQQPYPVGQPTAIYTAQAPASTVIIRQPGQMPQDYLVFAVIVTFMCCFPCGIVGIIKASEAKNRWRLGDAEGARRSSEEAKKWSMISLISGIVTNVSLIAFLIVYYTVIIGFSYGY